MQIPRAVMLKLVLEHLGISNINSFDDRKIMQKLIYLLQAFGVNLSYGFRWDSYGPYSQSLAEDAKLVLTKHKEMYDRLIRDENYKLTEETISYIDEYMNSIGNMVKENIEFGELLASIHFTNQLYDSDEKVKTLIEKTKPELVKKVDFSATALICHEQLKTLWRSNETL